MKIFFFDYTEFVLFDPTDNRSALVQVMALCRRSENYDNLDAIYKRVTRHKYVKLVKHLTGMVNALLFTETSVVIR